MFVQDGATLQFLGEIGEISPPSLVGKDDNIRSMSA
jgi:hypothetical protein|tara:strand:+ start:450 stop:557 length:108 start_codon:yes stop_codon:yes gene_type:complete